MQFTVEQDINLCLKHRLSPGQLMLMKILSIPDSLKLIEATLKFENGIVSYLHKIGGVTKEELSDLVSRKMIVNKKKEQAIDNFEVNPSIASDFEVPIRNKYEELFEEYPNMFTDDNGKTYNGKTSTTVEIEEWYNSNIDVEEHKEVLNDLRWGKLNNHITCGIAKFVNGKYWLALREMRDKAPKSSNIQLR